MKTKSLVPVVVFVIIFGIGLLLTSTLYSVTNPLPGEVSSVLFFLLALLISAAIRIADPWEKAVVLRLGKFHSLKGPGLFYIIPIVDTIPYWIDTRVITSSFKAEKPSLKTLCR